MATTSGNDPLSPSRQLGCDTCRISGQIGCRPATRTQHVRINNPVPTPGGTVGKISRSGVRESNPPHLLGRQRPKAARPTPLKSRALCLALRLPVSMRRIVACAGLWAGVFGWSESGSELSLPICPRPCAGGKANQNSIAVTRGINCPSNAPRSDGLWEPAAVQVLRSFLTAMNMGRAFYAPRIWKSSNVSTLNVGHNTSWEQEVL
jgi:hypothetical protein